MKGSIDFIVCEDVGCWYIQPLQVPIEIAKQNNNSLVEWAKINHFNNDPDISYIGVYWRDELLDEAGEGITTDAAIAFAYNLQNEIN